MRLVRSRCVGACGRTVILALALTISAPVARCRAEDLRVLDAVKRRDQKAFTSLLRAKADVNAAQPDGATALAWAVHLGQRSMAEALLDAGAKANTVDEYGETPLTLAAANGDARARPAAARGRRRTPRATRWNGETALMIAAGAGSSMRVRQLVLHGADVNAAEPRRGQTALMWAAAEGHADVVGALLEIGANVESGVQDRLHAARVRRRRRTTSTSIDDAARRPAPIRTYTLPSGNKPLHRGDGVPAHGSGAGAARAAAPTSTRAIAPATRRCIWPRRRATWMSSARCSPRAPIRTCARRDRRRRRAARGGGGGFAARPSGEQTPLMMAARGDHEDVMRALVAAGADPTLRAQDGTSVLMAAAAGARLDDVQVRLRDRSERRRRDDRRATPSCTSPSA